MFAKLIIVGNLGNDPELRYLQDGTAVCNFSVATNRRWTDAHSGEPVEETTWFRVSAWGRQAETINQYLGRGRKVLIEGRLVPDPATGGPRLFKRVDGTMGASYEVRALTIQFLDSPSEADEGRDPADEADDVPF